MVTKYKYIINKAVEHHPCKSMRIGVSKEGLSLFGILNKTTSVVGKELLRFDNGMHINC